MPKISLILPVYNAAGCLGPMLESISAQTMPVGDLELIVVDDASTDGSALIARAWSGEHTQIPFKFIRMDTNGGPGAARNAALEQASGEYVAFIDADDRLGTAYCQTLYDTAKDRGADLAWCRAQCTGADSRVLSNPDAGSTGRRRLLMHFRTYLWTCLFRREFLVAQGIAFPHTRCAEDSCMTLAALMAAGITASTREVLYYYHVGEGSLSARPGALKASDRRESMRALRRWAKSSGMYGLYRTSLEFVILKKGTLLSLIDRLPL